MNDTTSTGDPRPRCASCDKLLDINESWNGCRCTDCRNDAVVRFACINCEKLQARIAKLEAVREAAEKYIEIIDGLIKEIKKRDIRIAKLEAVREAVKDTEPMYRWGGVNNEVGKKYYPAEKIDAAVAALEDKDGKK